MIFRLDIAAPSVLLAKDGVPEKATGVQFGRFYLHAPIGPEGAHAFHKKLSALCDECSLRVIVVTDADQTIAGPPNLELLAKAFA